MANLKSLEEISAIVNQWVDYVDREFWKQAFWGTADYLSDMSNEVAEGVHESTAAYLRAEFGKIHDDDDVIDIDSGVGKNIIDGLPRAVWDGLTVDYYTGDVGSYDIDSIFTDFEDEVVFFAEGYDLTNPPESNEDRRYLVKLFFDELVHLATQEFETEADKLPEYVRNN